MRRLPLAGHRVVDVVGAGSSKTSANRASPADDVRSEYEPPCAAWVRDVLAGLVGVPVVDAKYDRPGNLVLSFEDGRLLRVNDGPFENWDYANAAGMRAIGGVGRVVTWWDGRVGPPPPLQPAHPREGRAEAAPYVLHSAKVK